MEYPWFDKVTGDDLMQGDLIDDCPIYIPPPSLATQALEEAIFDVEKQDVIIMTQSCDLFKTHSKVKEVLLCPVWQVKDINEGPLSTKDDLERARKGQLPAYHILNKSEIVGVEKDFRIVDFRKVYSLPLNYMREIAKTVPVRLRLNPPYREHLAQAFARYFMRVGLPVDIPEFK